MVAIELTTICSLHAIHAGLVLCHMVMHKITTRRLAIVFQVPLRNGNNFNKFKEYLKKNVETII
jgi:hypothetical protein